MNTIVFDIVYQKKTEIESIKLSTESEFQQLKIMLCGKYKIFDVTKLFIYYKNNLLVPNDDTQKLKEIFKSKKVKLEISNTPIKKQKPEKTETFKYYCKCKNGASYICDKCEEFLCDFCLKKKKHITHNQKLIKISDYSAFIKKLIQNMASELDERIMNDEAYKFLKYWNYDKEKEINNVNTKYEFLKKQLEDMKQIEIDYLIYLNEGNNYEVLKKEIVDTISQYSNFSTEEETIEEIIKQKNNIIKLSQDLFNRYNKIKLQLLNYTKNLKDLQTFNQIFQNMVQEKFNFIKKKLSFGNYQNLNININFNDTNESMLKSRFFTLNNDVANNSVRIGDDKINSSVKYMNEEDKNSRGISVKLNSENKEIDSKYSVKTIKIIWNRRFLIKSESNNNWYLVNRQDYNNIELWSFFQKMYDYYFDKISIDKCFEEFTKEEEFDVDNLWKCSKCKNNIPAKNKIEIYQTPKILIIQLKRFKNNEKIKTFVEFPLTNLDISRFVSHNKSKYNGLNKKYDLFAVANHYGELEYGHYDAYCLNYIDNHWYNFDDKDVHYIDKKYEKDAIVRRDAYVLFYREQNSDLINWEKIYNKNFVEINDNNLKTYEEDFIYNKSKNRNKEERIIDIFEELVKKANSKENENNKNEKNNKGNENNDEESENFEDISLGGFVYNPFKESYLKLKRLRSKNLYNI